MTRTIDRVVSRLQFLRNMKPSGEEAVDTALQIIHEEFASGDFSLTNRELVAALHDTKAIERGMTPEQAMLHIVASVRSRR